MPDDKAKSRDEVKTMNRSVLTRLLVGKLKAREAVVGGIGNTNFDLWASGQRPENFYMLGSMGMATPIALGVAVAQPNRKVFALDGDGSILMQLGALGTVAAAAPKNCDHHLGQRPLPDHRLATDADFEGYRSRCDGQGGGHRAKLLGFRREAFRSVDRKHPEQRWAMVHRGKDRRRKARGNDGTRSGENPSQLHERSELRQIVTL